MRELPVEQWAAPLERTKMPFLRPASDGTPVAPSYGMQFLTLNLSRSTFWQKRMPLSIHTMRAQRQNGTHGELLLEVPHVHRHAADV